VGYQYPHLTRQGIITEHYFPIGMKPRVFYDPTDRGFEREVRERLERIRSIVRSPTGKS
jgi:putative ATPase